MGEGEKMKIKYIEYRCKKCGKILWTDKEEEMRIWKELQEQHELRCPICGNEMQPHRAKVKIPAQPPFILL